mgnify:CR=1 FL=1
MEGFGPAVRAWFQQSFAQATEVQTRGWSHIAQGEHSLLIAPTGSGKTLAAFLWCIDRIVEEGPRRSSGVRVLYVSPLKALVYDVERNLRAPLIGVQRMAERLGLPPPSLRVAVRTGDTTQKERRQQERDPAEILVTTPESLYLMLGSAVRETLRSVDTLIVDEVHALAPTKRGAHLALSLERLSALCERDPQRIGLSATARPLSEVALYLGGDRPVTIVDTHRPPALDLEVVVPVPDMTQPIPVGEGGEVMEALAASSSEGSSESSEGAEVEREEADDDLAHDLGALLEPSPSAPALGEGSVLFADPPTMVVQSIWPALYPRLIALIRAHRSSIIFVNSRGLCERLALKLNEMAGETLVQAHHGSLAFAQRREVEEALKEGRLPAIVATSSLELGIDMGAVDLVVLVESPGSVARGLQRIGRAGHGVGEVSKGRVFPKHRGDLLEATVVARRMLHGEVEALRMPRNPLDVLGQQIVAMCSVETWALRDLEALVRRASMFRELPRDAFLGTLDMLAGRYPSNAFADLRSRLIWDRESDQIQARKGAKALAMISGGTIPDRGLYAVHMGEEGPRVGELDEEMVHETTPGQTFLLGASTWKVQRVTRDRVIVMPAPGEPGKLPFWRGEGPGRPLELGKALGAFVRKLAGSEAEEAERWLAHDYRLDPWAAQNLIRYVHEQKAHCSVVPSDRSITIERFRDEIGDWRVCILSPFGARIHAPWALALEASIGLQAGFEVQTLWNDDGIVLRFTDEEQPPESGLLVPLPDEVEEKVVDQLGRSALFATHFRENAARSLLLPRRRPGSRTPLWAQRLKAQQLLAVARQFPSFPVLMATYRTCLHDVFDLPALVEILRAIQAREIRVDHVETPSPSPFARSLVFAYVATAIYEGDTPLAERKAQALSLDRALLRELLGHDDLRDLLDPEVLESFEDELQGRAPDYRAGDPDALHDLLRRVGDLSEIELRERCTEDPGPWLSALSASKRAIGIRLGGEPRWVVVEDAGLYRDALGALPPSGVPAVFLEAVPQAIEQLVARWVRTHGPFAASVLQKRYDLRAQELEGLLQRLVAQGALVRGTFRPGALGEEYCEPEVLRRIKRRTLAKLRREVAPVERRALATFLPAWQGLRVAQEGGLRLEEALTQLEGLPLPFRDLEEAILPARVERFEARHLDELGAMGWLVWVGRGALGGEDGRIALYRRDRVGRFIDPPSDELLAGDPIRQRIVEHLRSRGACFFAELEQVCSPATRADVRAALWDLVWAGVLTNDTLTPLRALRKSARRPQQEFALVAGRWSLVADLLGKGSTATEKQHARALTLLERHGILCRESLGIEDTPGGFSALYPVLTAMEEEHKARRGYFIEGLGGMQFALPGAVDRLRAQRQSKGGSEALLLSAVDPANPFGWLLPWPMPRVEDRPAPRRSAGSSVVLVDGELYLYLERAGKRVTTFAAGADRPRLVAALKALASLAHRRGSKLLRIDEIDGEAARQSSLATLFREAGFNVDHRGLFLEGKLSKAR